MALNTPGFEELLRNGSLQDIANLLEDLCNEQRSRNDELNFDIVRLIICAGRSDSQDIILHMLRKKMCLINDTSSGENLSLLHMALQAPNELRATELVNFLLASGCDPTLRNKKLRTAYDCALAKNYDSVASILSGQRNGADVQQKLARVESDKYGKQLISGVAVSNEIAINECFRMGANTNLLNKEGAGAIHYAVTLYCGHVLSLLDQIYKAGVDINLVNHENDTALNLAIKNTPLRSHADTLQIVTWLLNHDAKADILDLDGQNARDLAQSRGLDDVVALLDTHFPTARPTEMDQLPHVAYMKAESPTITNADEEDGNYEIHKAVYLQTVEDRLSRLNTLLEQGADISATNRKGNTVLHCAAQIGDVKTVQFLLEKQASRHILNNKHETAYDVAMKHAHEEVAAVLKGVQNIPSRAKSKDKISKRCFIL